MKKPTAVYDPVLKRYRATCPECEFAAVRAKRESAEWNLGVHMSYAHSTEKEPA